MDEEWDDISCAVPIGLNLIDVTEWVLEMNLGGVNFMRSCVGLRQCDAALTWQITGYGYESSPTSKIYLRLMIPKL